MNHTTTIAALPSKGAYAAAWKRLKTLPLDGVVALRRNDGLHEVSRVRSQFRKALDHRINSRAGNDAANVPVDYELVRDARALDDMLQRRIRVYQFATPFMRARFGHLLARHDD